MTNTTGNNPREDTLKLTPSTAATFLFNLYNQLIFSQVSNYGCVEISGIYKQGRGPEYGNGDYYDQLEDESDKGRTLTLVVGKKLRLSLQEGRLYNLRGILEARKSRQSLGMDVLCRISEIIGEQSGRLSPEKITELENKGKLLAARNCRGTRDLRSIIQNAIYEKRTVKGLFFYGTTAIVREDVQDSIEEIKKMCDFNFEERFFSMDSEKGLVQAFKRVDKTFDFVAVIRGGGIGIELFDSYNIAKAFVESPIPVLCAIGHKADTPFAEQVADMAFSTPTELGTKLLRIVESIVQKRDVEVERLRAIAQNRLEKEKKEISERAEKLEQKLEQATKDKQNQEIKAKELETQVKNLQQRFEEERKISSRLEAKLRKTMSIKAAGALLLTGILFGVFFGKLIFQLL